MRNAIIGIAIICAAAIAGFTFLGPAIGGPDYVSPLDFSDEAQVKRRVNGYFSGIKGFRFAPNMADMSQILGPDGNAEVSSGYGEDTTAREEMQQYYDSYADSGLDYQQVFDAIVANLHVRIEEVDVDGDTAKCLLRIDFPDFSTIGDELSGEDDFSTITYEERMSRINEAISDPSAPLTNEEHWVVLNKENGAWDFDFLDDESEMWPFYYFCNATRWCESIAYVG